MMSENVSDSFSLPVSHGGIVCDRLQRPEIDDVAGVVAKAFVTREPMSNHLGIPFDDMFALCRSFTEQVFDDGLCLVCRDGEGRVVGGTLCRDLTTEVDFSVASQRFMPIFALLEQVVDKGFPPERMAALEKGQGLEIFTTGVDPDRVEKGIGRWLIETASAYFASRGYAFSLTEATSPITQSLRTQCGFDLLATVDYGAFEHGGKKPFADIDFSTWPTAVKLFPEGRAGAALLCKQLVDSHPA